MDVLSMRRARAAASALILLASASWADESAAQKRCRGGKQPYAGQCLYPEEIRKRREQAERDKAATEARKKAEQERQAAEAQGAQDRERCEQARDEDTLDEWRGYVDEYPEGACLAEAQARIRKLEQEAGEEPSQPTEAAQGDDAASPGSTSPMAYVGFALAGAGLLTWGIAGGISISHRSTLSEECPGDVCSPGMQDVIDEGETAGNIATAGIVVMGVGAALGIVGLVVPWSEESDQGDAAVSVRPLLGPGTIGLSGRF